MIRHYVQRSIALISVSPLLKTILEQARILAYSDDLIIITKEKVRQYKMNRTLEQIFKWLTEINIKSNIQPIQTKGKTM